MVVELVYTADLKSAASNGLRVRVPPIAFKTLGAPGQNCG